MFEISWHCSSSYFVYHLQLQQNTIVPIDVNGQMCHFCSQGLSENKVFTNFHTVLSVSLHTEGFPFHLFGILHLQREPLVSPALEQLAGLPAYIALAHN